MRSLLRLLALLISISLFAAACGDDDPVVEADDTEESTDDETTDDETFGVDDVPLLFDLGRLDRPGDLRKSLHG